MPFDRERMKVKAMEIAVKGVLIDTSSWEYDGWFGQLYTRGALGVSRQGRKDALSAGFA